MMLFLHFYAECNTFGRFPPQPIEMLFLLRKLFKFVIPT